LQGFSLCPAKAAAHKRERARRHYYSSQRQQAGSSSKQAALASIPPRLIPPLYMVKTDYANPAQERPYMQYGYHHQNHNSAPTLFRK